MINKEKKMKKIVIILAIVLLTTFCQSNNKNIEINRTITILKGCSDIEVLSDLNYSVTNIKKYLEKNKIEIILDEKTDECGYLLVSKDRSKKISSVLTDVDLLEEVKSFYKISIE